MKDGTALLAAMAIFAVILAGFWGISAAVSAIKCSARRGDVEHRYRLIGGCQVQGHQGWVPASAYREISQ